MTQSVYAEERTESLTCVIEIEELRFGKRFLYLLLLQKSSVQIYELELRFFQIYRVSGHSGSNLPYFGSFGIKFTLFPKFWEFKNSNEFSTKDENVKMTGILLKHCIFAFPDSWYLDNDNSASHVKEQF